MLISCNSHGSIHGCLKIGQSLALATLHGILGSLKVPILLAFSIYDDRC